MKNTTYLILFLNSFIFSVSGQVFQNGYWMPKEYIDNIKLYKSPALAQKFLKPIESVLVKDTNKIEIQTFRSEPISVKVVKMKDQSNTPIFLVKQVHFNLNDTSLAKYKNAKFYIIPYRKNMLIKIISETKTDSIIFTNRIDSFSKVDHPFITNLKILMDGMYTLYDTSNMKLEDSVKISASGKIQNSIFFNTYKITQFYSTTINDKNNFYNIIYLKNKKGNRFDFMFRRRENGDIELYDFESIYRKGYNVGKLAFVLKRT